MSVNFPSLVRYTSPARSVLTDGTNRLTLTDSAWADARTEVNAHPTTYSLPGGTVLPALPTIAANAIGVAYSQAKAYLSNLFAGYASDDTATSTAACATLVTTANLLALIAANTALLPAISVQPSNHTVAHPTGTSFSVTATGAGLSYQWQRSPDGGTNWLNVANTSIYTGAATATLSISDSTGFNALKFRCVVTNNSGTATSNSATLTVT